MASSSLIAIDPGDKYVGYAMFERPELDFRDNAGNPAMGPWECTSAHISSDPHQFLLDFAESIVAGDFDVVVYERFLLKADLALKQEGSEFETSQMIGAIKWIVTTHNIHARAHADAVSRGLLTTCELPGQVCSDPDKPLPREVVLVGQQPQVQGKNGPAVGILRARKIKSVAKAMGALPHGLSAELHGWYTIGRHIERWGQL